MSPENLAHLQELELFYDGAIPRDELTVAIGSAEAGIRWHRQALRRLVRRGPARECCPAHIQPRGTLRAIKAAPHTFTFEQKKRAWAAFAWHRARYREEQAYLRECLAPRWQARRRELLAAG
jgi:hypothetical protein